MWTPLIVIVVAIAAILYVSGFIHELGHAIMGWRNGFVISSFGLGWGRPLWVVRWRGTRIYFCLRRPFNGFTFAVAPQIYFPRRQMVGLLLGGVLADAVAAAVAVVLWWILPGHYILLLVAAGWSALSTLNLIPFRFRVGKFAYFSDGALVLQTLRGNPRELVESIRYLEIFGGHLESVGDNLALSDFQLGAALAWTALGVPEKAEQLCSQAEALPVDDWPFCRSYAAVVRGIVALSSGRIEDSERALDEAEKAFSGAGNQGGLFLVSSARADLNAAQGNTEQATSILSALRQHPILAQQPQLQIYLLASAITYYAAAGDPKVEELRNEYEAFPNRRRPLISDLQTYRALGQLYTRREEHEKAVWAYRVALIAASDLYCSLLAPEVQKQFLEAQKSFLSEAKDSLRRQILSDLSTTGKEGVMPTTTETALLDSANEKVEEEILTLFPPPVPTKLRPAKTKFRQHRGLVWILTAVNLALTPFAVMAVVQMEGWLGQQPEEYEWAKVFMLFLLFCSILGLFTCFFCLAGSGQDYSMRRFNGLAALILMLSPLLTSLVLIAVNLIVNFIVEFSRIFATG